MENTNDRDSDIRRGIADYKDDDSSPVDKETVSWPEPGGAPDTFPGSSVESPPRPGFLDLIYGVLFDPVPTFRRVAAEPPLGSAILIFTVVTLISTLMGILLTPRMMNPGYPGMPMAFLMQAVGPFMAVGGLLFQFLKWFINSALLHLLAELFRGRGKAVGVLTAAGLASLPSIFMVPVNLLMVFVNARGFTATALSGLFSLAIIIWGMVLLVIGIREVHSLSTGRALTVVVIPPLAVILLGVILLVALVAGAASLPEVGPWYQRIEL